VFFAVYGFVKYGRMTLVFQNPALPDVPTHQGDRVGECQCLSDSSRPGDSWISAFVLGSSENHKATSL